MPQSIFTISFKTQIILMTSLVAKLLFPTKPWPSFLNKQQREMWRFSWSQGGRTPATGPDVQPDVFAEHTKDSM